jgi:hypothetical protein
VIAEGVERGSSGIAEQSRLPFLSVIFNWSASLHVEEI